MFSFGGGAAGAGGLGGMRQQPETKADTSEQIYISSLALLKMLKHCRAGVPLEVMGLMLGEFVDEYTIKVVDVFAMPQSGTSVSVQSVDPAYQQQILEMLKQTQRSEMVVGWYHSHPSFGCWLSNVDINTQQSFERLNPKTVAVVLDPIQSVRGKVVIDAFRLIDTVTLSTGAEARQTTSNLGYLNKPSMEAVFKGLNRYYYSINISYRSNELEQKMLLNLYKNKWSKCLKLEDPGKAGESVSAGITKCAKLGVDFQKRIEEEVSKSESELKIKNTGKLDPKRHTQEEVTSILKQSLLGIINNMISTAAF